MPGSLDTEGVYQYAEDDLLAPWSDYMNLGQASVSDALGALRLEVRSPGTSVALLPSTPWVTTSSEGIPSIVVRSGLVHLTGGMVIRPSALTVAAGATQGVGTLPAIVADNGWLPSYPVYGMGAVFANSGTPVPAYVAVLPDRSVVFVPSASVTFGSTGGTINSVRFPTISWIEP